MHCISKLILVTILIEEHATAATLTQPKLKQAPGDKDNLQQPGYFDMLRTNGG